MSLGFTENPTENPTENLTENPTGIHWELTENSEANILNKKHKIKHLLIGASAHETRRAARVH
jgi:hypothetical protein